MKRLKYVLFMMALLLVFPTYSNANEVIKGEAILGIPKDQSKDWNESDLTIIDATLDLENLEVSNSGVILQGQLKYDENLIDLNKTGVILQTNESDNIYVVDFNESRDDGGLSLVHGQVVINASESQLRLESTDESIVGFNTMMLVFIDSDTNDLIQFEFKIHEDLNLGEKQNMLRMSNDSEDLEPAGYLHKVFDPSSVEFEEFVIDEETGELVKNVDQISVMPLSGSSGQISTNCATVTNCQRVVRATFNYRDSYGRVTERHQMDVRYFMGIGFQSVNMAVAVIEKRVILNNVTSTGGSIVQLGHYANPVTINGKLTNDKMSQMSWDAQSTERRTRLTSSIGVSFGVFSLGVPVEIWSGQPYSSVGFRNLVPHGQWEMSFKDTQAFRLQSRYDHSVSLQYGQHGSFAKQIRLEYKLPFYERGSNSFFSTHTGVIDTFYYRP